MSSVIQEDPNSATYLLKQILAELKTLNGFANPNQTKPAVAETAGEVGAAQETAQEQGEGKAPAA